MSNNISSLIRQIMRSFVKPGKWKPLLASEIPLRTGLRDFGTRSRVRLDKYRHLNQNCPDPTFDL